MRNIEFPSLSLLLLNLYLQRLLPVENVPTPVILGVNQQAKSLKFYPQMIPGRKGYEKCPILPQKTSQYQACFEKAFSSQRQGDHAQGETNEQSLSRVHGHRGPVVGVPSCDSRNSPLGLSPMALKIPDKEK